MSKLSIAFVLFVLACSLPSTTSAQVVIGEKLPVEGDPGLYWMMAANEPAFMVLRDFAEPGATRRLHSHTWATYHVLTLITGNIRLTVEDDDPVDVIPGQVVTLPGGANHTFINTSDVTATLVEVFGK